MSDGKMEHGHVRERVDGKKNPCGGPITCQECAAELSLFGMKELAAARKFADDLHTEKIKLELELVQWKEAARVTDQARLSLISDREMWRKDKAELLRRIGELDANKF